MSVSRRNFLHAALTGLTAGAISRGKPPTGGRSATNLVIILTDNQGAWTLGCYGNPDIKTPHIDSLAREGIRFTRAFSVNAVCSPTRATLLTGLIPSQHGVHCYLTAGGAQMGPNAYCTIGEFRTLSQVLADAGYTCGLVGKWHLGANRTPQEGFSYWITKPHGHTTTFYGAEVIENGKVRREGGYLTDLWTRHAVRFLDQNARRRFVLLLAYNGPYGLGGSLLKPARNRHAAFYADKPMKSFPRRKVHPWQRNNRQYVNNIKAIRRYAAECSGVDDGVGEVLATLKRLGLDDSTLVVYTADQGWGGGQHGLWGMGDHTRPLHAFDDTMHIPLIFRHKGTIRPGQTCDRLIAQYDLMPTLLARLALADKVPARPPSPGRDFSAALAGRPLGNWDDVIFYEFENTRVIRTADAKLILRHPAGPNELYDLRTDPGETKNLFDAPSHTAARKDLHKQLTTFFARYANPKYDLWKSGRSKAKRILRPPK